MGPLRCWLIRTVLVAGLAAASAACWVMHDWVSPDRVRAALVAALCEQLPDAEVEVGSARLRLFGGISVSDLTLTRKGESEPFLTVPSAVIAHDKEQLSRGRLVVRKLELDGPTVRLVRQADGAWNVSGLVRGGGGGRPIPTLLVRNATVLVADRRPAGLPPLALVDAKLSMLNDPVTVVKFEAKGTVTPAAGGERPPGGGLAVPVAASVRFNRATREFAVRLEADDIAFGPELAPAVARVHPQLADYAAQFRARLGVKADLTGSADAPRALDYDVRLDVRDGRYEDADLPWPVEQLTAAVRVRDGKVTVEKGTARVGKAWAEFALETRSLVDPPRQLAPAPEELPAAPPGPRVVHIQPPALDVLSTPTKESTKAEPPADNPLAAIEDRLERIDVTVREVALSDELFAKLPPKAHRVREMFAPTGSVDVAYRLARTGPAWKREVDVRPNRVGVVYEKFRYPAADVTGSVKKVTASDGTDEFRVQLMGKAAGRRVELTGRVAGDGPDPLIDLKFSGTDFPIDDRVFAALPPKYAASLAKLRATARGDFTVDIRQPRNVNRCENSFAIRLFDGSMCYAHFPYPLTGVKGHVLVRVTATDAARPLLPGMPLAAAVDTDRVEVREFEAAHAGGRLWLNGDVESVPGTRDRRLTLRVQGERCPVDADLVAAFAELKAGDVLTAFNPRGYVTFGADLEILDRHGSGRPASPTSPAADSYTAVAAALPGEPPFRAAEDLKFTVNFKGLSVTPSFFRYPLDDLAGVLRYDGGNLGLARFSARHGNSRLALDAAEVRFADGGEVWANAGGIKVHPLIVDDDFRAALPPALRDGLRALNPRGAMELSVKHLVVRVPPGGGPEVVARGQTPEAPSPQTAVGPDAVLYWNGELKFAGAAFDAGLEWHDVHGAVASVGRYEGTHLGAVLGHAWIDSATVARHPVTAVKVSYRMRGQEPDPHLPGRFTPPVVEFPDLSASAYHGTVGGEARVTLADPVRYRVWLTAAGVRLDKLAEQMKLGSGAELRGLAQGKLLVENLPDPKTGQLVRVGAGQIDVPNGRLYNLPVLLPLLKLLKLQAPDQTAFEEAHAVFELAGDRVRVSQLDLVGSAVSLGGSGELSCSGDDARFEFYTVWSQALKRWLTTPLGDVTSFLSGNLFRIEVVKQNGEMKYVPHMLPAVTDPVRAVAERLRDRVGRLGDPDRPTARATGPR